MGQFLQIMHHLVQKQKYSAVSFHFIPSTSTTEGDNGENPTLCTIECVWRERDQKKENTSVAASFGGREDMLVDSTWNAKWRAEVNGDVADSLVELRKTFCAAKKEARKKYVNCDFCQMDYDLILTRAASAIRTLPIQIDYLNEKGKTAFIAGVGDATVKCIHLVLGSPLGHMKWKCTLWRKHKKEMIQIDIEWVNKYNAD